MHRPSILRWRATPVKLPLSNQPSRALVSGYAEPGGVLLNPAQEFP